MPRKSPTKARKTYTSDQPVTCAGCRQAIEVGQPFWRGTTKEPWHPSCKRMGVNVARPVAKRYLTDDPVGQTCEGCDMEIHAEDEVVFKSAKPWHKECCLRR